MTMMMRSRTSCCTVFLVFSILAYHVRVEACPYLRQLLGYDPSAIFENDQVLQGHRRLQQQLIRHRHHHRFTTSSSDNSTDSSIAAQSNSVASLQSATTSSSTGVFQVSAPTPTAPTKPTTVAAPVSSPTSTPSAAAVNVAIQNAKADITALIRKDTSLIPQFMRLIFHDCVGGRCDGCVNLTDSHNFGLANSMAALEGTIVKTYKTWLTRGDLYVLAALTTAEVAQPQDSTKITFNMDGYGRIPCSGSFKQGPRNHMAGAQLTTSQLMDFFHKEFNYTTRQVVAIMGAHTLGRAFQQNSGFNGDHWTIDPLVLNNNYYRAMTNLKSGSIRTVRSDYVLTPQTNPSGSAFPSKQFFWTRFISSSNSHDFLFNADIALAVNLTGFMDSTTGKVTCALNGSSNSQGLPTCPQVTSTLSIVTEYANDNSKWKSDFRQALLQMSDVGYRKTSGCGQPICRLVPL